MITRRQLLEGAGLTAAVGAGALAPRSAGAEPPPETTRIRLVRIGAICMSPMFVAEDLLRAEGFSDVQYAGHKTLGGVEQALATGEVDVALTYSLRLAQRLDAGEGLVALAGVHTGCVELFAGGAVRSVRDLKGKRVASGRAATGLPGLLSIILGQVGLAVGRDVELVTRPENEAIELFAQGKVEAFLGIPPEPQELRARKIGRVLLDTGRDRPWSQYFCCMVVANREFHRRHPIATKRAVRAILKATDMCGTDPAGAARLIVDRGYTPSYDRARETLAGLRYRAWREYDPEEALRFYALRLHEAGSIKTNPKKLIAEGTDWRILRELKKELKA
jgi:NitT/TauT family transport system substrate-binding protein